MAIYLDEQTRPYLERLIKKRVEKSDKDFIAERIDKMLVADQERLNSIRECSHITGTYSGKKTCCTKCGSSPKGGRTEWTLKQDR